MSSGIGSAAGSAIAAMLGLPPQAGAIGGNFAEEALFKKKKPEGEEGDDDGTGAAISAVISNLFQQRMGGQDGGMGGGQDPFSAAIMGAGVVEPETTMAEINPNKEIYSPPQLLGFPSSGRPGQNAAIKAALAAKRGF